jgi:hypothetical protein
VDAPKATPLEKEWNQLELQLNFKKEYDRDGDEYLDSLIQIPIYTPELNDEEILEIVKKRIPEDQQNDYIRPNIPIITSTERNPGKIIRLLDTLNFYSLLFDKSNVIKELLDEGKSSDATHNNNVKKKDTIFSLLVIMHILSYKWNHFYKALVKLDDSERKKVLTSLYNVQLEGEHPTADGKIKAALGFISQYLSRRHVNMLIDNYDSNKKLIQFLKRNVQILNNVYSFNYVKEKIAKGVVSPTIGSGLLPDDSTGFTELFNSIKIHILQMRKRRQRHQRQVNSPV